MDAYLSFAVIIVLVVGLFIWPGYLRGGSNSPKVEKITAQEVKEMLQKDKNVILLDVRTESEYRNGHIPKSVLLPVTEIERKAVQKFPDRDKTMIVYCQSGSRSTRAAKILTKLGYSKVYNLGGISQWPYNTVK